ncbi:MAG: PASTA domain-containing protein, partial [Candidatus Aminicenantes bacterium]|nr:PASTA domain-containing protein [Candidatus Aminicenantes bacterium]
EIQELGLNLGVLTQVYSPEQKPSVVISQIPAPGETISKEGYIDLLISKPYEEAFVMPDFIGKDFSLVEISLKEMGFKVATPEFIYYPGWEAGIIVKQLPFPGYKITRNQVISFKVTK